MTKTADGQPEKNGSWSAALRILTRRDYSCLELSHKLTEKGFPSEQVDETIQRCLELGYLDDERFATNRAASLMNQGRAVGYRILKDLRQKGISEELAEQALESARVAIDENRVLADLVTRRFPGFNYHSAPAKEKRRVVNFLQRRGFPLSLIMEYLTRKGSAADYEDR